ncbi:pyridoxal-phosphate dependent enzyme [Lentzea sp. DG1S-22]|uniref:pyridoxal-phosphate dependent enzyme n=1 Tax=Lentzea sp. DG1S-22 TaxID=3108822 RepID=UPI002E79E7F1|nr:pyridoxal-phosphate dependent enzyme [Lentzea sp. DG1S-22]WVH82782.1 pyridoxal-phosphate dependent enzyme [Lentzea sp. DG1S-22]
MLFDNVRDAIGHTPLVRLEVDTAAFGVEVYAKLEMQNLFGMKDRVAKKVILEARRVGALAPGAPIVESSSGTMALGVALVGRSLGHAVHIVTDPRIDPITLAKLRAMGCQVHIVQAMGARGGWQSARIAVMEDLLAQMPDAFCPRQYSNPDNPGSYAEMADEIFADLGQIDVLVGTVGSGGSLTGTSRALRRSVPKLRVVGIDCVGSALFDQPDRPQRLQSGLGNSLLPHNLDRRQIDEVHWLNDHEAFAAARELAAEQQIFGGNTAGSVYRVLKDVAARAEPGHRVVGIFPDRGDRYYGTVFNDEHWAEHDLNRLPLAPTAEVIEYGSTAHSWSRADAGTIQHDQLHMLFVESNTTGTGMAALHIARGLRLRPVLLTSQPQRYRGLADTGAETLVCDTNDLVALRAAIQQRFRREAIAGVTTTSDFYTPFAAEIATWLGLPGNSADAVRVCRNKALLRARLAEVGVPQPKFAVVADPEEIPTAVSSVGLPCVVKPADESGSTDVVLCRTIEEADEHARRVLAVRHNARGLPTERMALIEEYLDGPEFSVELFTGQGRHWAGVTAKTVTPGPRFVEHRHVFPAPVDDEAFEQLIEVATLAVQAAGMVSGATHTELKLTTNGPAIIEVNPRLAGGMIPELVRLACGVDLLEQQVRLAAGLPLELAEHQDRTAGIQFLLCERDGVVADVRGVREAGQVDGIDQIAVNVRPGDPIKATTDAYTRLGHIIGCTPDLPRLTKALDEAMSRLTVSVLDEPVAGDLVGTAAEHAPAATDR